MTRALLLLAAGCVGPLVSDRPGPADVLPPGSTVPAASGDLAEQIADHDNLAGTVPQLSAFEAGAPAHYWDLGPAPSFAAPMFVLTQGGAPLDQPAIVEALPGDPGYSPFWAVFDVAVTDRYAGEVIPSIQALDEAEAAGLVDAPAATGTAEDYAIVGDDVMLAGAGAPGDTLYARGVAVHAFDFGSVPLAGDAVAPVRRYVLRREGQDPLSEPIRHVDMTLDRDLDDTNDILAGDAPLCDEVDVSVITSVNSIDTSHDETIADLTSASQLFAPRPTMFVVAYQDTGVLGHCPRGVE